jgi:hypothetical protein
MLMFFRIPSTVIVPLEFLVSPVPSLLYLPVLREFDFWYVLVKHVHAKVQLNRYPGAIMTIFTSRSLSAITLLKAMVFAASSFLSESELPYHL